MRMTFLKKMLVFLMVTSSGSSAAVAADLTISDLSPAQQHQVAQSLIAGEVCQRNSIALEAAYKSCAAKHVAPSFLGTPTFVIGEFVVTVAATAIVLCAAHVGGMCQ